MANDSGALPVYIVGCVYPSLYRALDSLSISVYFGSSHLGARPVRVVGLRDPAAEPVRVVSSSYPGAKPVYAVTEPPGTRPTATASRTAMR
jgi:hypothetical protein